MKGTPADSFRAGLEDDSLVVEFGQSAQPDADGGPVAVSDRIRMPLETAKRLVLALKQPLERHAARLHADPMRGHVPANAPADEAGARASLLLRRVSEFGVPYDHERSFRVSAGSLLGNRFLLTVNTRDIPGDARARALDICDQFDMPPELRRTAAERFAMAKCVHFGFEAGDGSILCKLYLEREVPAEEASEAARRAEGVLLHLAFKWDLVRKAQVVTQYLWYPALSAAGIEARLLQIYRGGEPAVSLAIARAVLDLAARRAPAERLQYLEVQEPDNGRRSFDLNLYDAGLQLKDAQGELYRMREHFALRPGEFQALYDQVKTRSFGHLAGGVHRDRKDFFNIYYGAAGLPRFSARLG